MALSLSEEMREQYHLAAMRNAARQHLTGRQWGEIRDIGERYTKARNQERQQYDDQYLTRVERARKRLMNERATPRRTFDHPWARRDAFDNEAIRRQAHRDVQNAHAARITTLVREERGEIDDVCQRAGVANKVKDQLRSEFERKAGQARDQPRDMSRDRDRSE